MKKEFLLNYIIKRVTAIKGYKEGKEISIKYYTKNQNKLESFSIVKLQDFNFEREVEIMQAKYDKIITLEIHINAPELNVLYMKDNTIMKTPQAVTIAEAVKFVEL